MLKREEVKQLVQKYYSEANGEQIEKIVEELSREIEIMIHAKIRELVNSERIKKSI
jgi:DNA-binding protein Fis